MHRPAMFDAGPAGPAHHIVMCFASADDATTAVLMLHERAFDAADVAVCTAAQMRHRLVTAPAAPRQSLSCATAQLELARRGFSFVLVRAANHAHALVANQIAQEAHVHCIQDSGRGSTEDRCGGRAAARHVLPAQCGQVVGEQRRLPIASSAAHWPR